jgi:hypothetical protein
MGCAVDALRKHFCLRHVKQPESKKPSTKKQIRRHKMPKALYSQVSLTHAPTRATKIF